MYMFIVIEEAWESTGISTFQRFSNSAWTSLHLVLKSLKPFLEHNALKHQPTTTKTETSMEKPHAWIRWQWSGNQHRKIPGAFHGQWVHSHALPATPACMQMEDLKAFFFDSKLKPNASPETKQYFLGKKSRPWKTTGRILGQKNLLFLCGNVWKIPHGRQLWRWMEDYFPFQLGDWGLVSVSGLEKRPYMIRKSLLDCCISTIRLSISWVSWDQSIGWPKHPEKTHRSVSEISEVNGETQYQIEKNRGQRISGPSFEVDYFLC